MRSRGRSFSFFPLGSTWVVDLRLGCCNSRNGNTERGAADIVKSGTVEEVHRSRVTTVLSTDAKDHARLHSAGSGDGDLDELSYACLVDASEGISRQDRSINVGRDKSPQIITGYAPCGLRQIYWGVRHFSEQRANFFSKNLFIHTHHSFQNS
jgi:hypothetical protein